LVLNKGDDADGECDVKEEKRNAFRNFVGKPEGKKP